ncbi:hypothetical protein OpiT1DRAFT_04754 [Opitutaceae bacterium TAV1]|nr:hypothetical protein OpiT1DRAFT_04754 [Opitutaceae bacterium TAV1]
MATTNNPAKDAALAKLGLDWSRLDKWTADQKQAYLAEYAAQRLNYPEVYGGANDAAADNYELWGNTAIETPGLTDYFGYTLDALGESVAELPGRINTGISLTVPVWLRWLIGGAIVAYLIPFFFSRK